MNSRLEVVWTELAVRDLLQIFDHIEAEAPMAARKLFDRIVEHARALQTLPLRGSAFPVRRRLAGILKTLGRRPDLPCRGCNNCRRSAGSSGQAGGNASAPR